MKLTSCYIVNFGKLHEFSWSFHDGLNIFIKENGSGKTTFATFLRVMFYGFENERKKDIAGNERKKYMPFNGGTYGGEVIFTVKDKSYRMVRTFGNSASLDTFELYDASTNNVCNDFSSNIGMELFHVDSTSFLNTVCVLQQNRDVCITSDLQAGITSLSFEQHDLKDYEDASDAIKKEMNRLNPNYKRSYTSELQEKIQTLRLKTCSMDSIRDAINQNISKQNEIIQEQKHIRNELIRLEDDIKNVTYTQEHSYLLDRKEGYEKAINLKEDEIRALESRYPNGFLNKEEFDDVIQLRFLYEKSLDTCQSAMLKEEEVQRFNELKARFTNRKVSVDQLKVIDQQLITMEEQRGGKSIDALNEEEKKELDGYNKEFEKDLITKEELDQLIFDTKASLKAISAYYDKEGRSFLSQLKPLDIILICLFVILGVVAYMVEGTYMYYELLGCLVGFIVVLSIRKHVVTKEMDQLRISIKQERDQVDQCQRILHKYGKDSFKDQMIADLYDIKADVVAYENLQLKLNSKKAYTPQQAAFLKQLNQYLTGFGLGGNEIPLQLRLRQLIGEVEEYNAFNVRNETLIAYRNQMHTYMQRLELVQSKYGLKDTGISTLNALRDAGLIYGQCYHQLDMLQEEYNHFLKEHTEIVDIDTDMIVPSILELQNRQADLLSNKDILSKKKFELEQEFDEYSKQVMDLEEALRKEKQYKEEYDECIHQYDVLVNTQDQLQKARDAFTKQYMKPMQEAFDHYYSLLDPQKKYDIELNNNLEAILIVDKQHKDIHLLSEGHLDLVNFARRMALIDAVYTEEKPFLILDDPFVNLDEGNLQEGLRFLNKAANDYQMMYMTCHPSRNPLVEE